MRGILLLCSCKEACLSRCTEAQSSNSQSNSEQKSPVLEASQHSTSNYTTDSSKKNAWYWHKIRQEDH
jgi:hypothetical protein